jgi:hypothetical protein
MEDDPRRPEAGEYHDSREGNRQKQAAEGDGLPPTTPPVEEEHIEGARQSASAKKASDLTVKLAIAIILLMMVVSGAFLLLRAFVRGLFDVVFM